MAQLSGHRLAHTDREDIVQEVFQRVWRSSQSVAFESPGAWWRWLRTTCSRCTVDAIRSSIPGGVIDGLEDVDVAADEVNTVDELIEMIEDRESLYRLADEVFLGVPRDMTPRERRRRLLAAKLLLVDRLPWQSVIHLINAGSSEEPILERKDLDRWIGCHSVLRSLAYTELNWDNQKLYQHLVDSVGPLEQAHDPLTAMNWSKDALDAIRLRYLNALLLEQIASRMADRLTKGDLIAVFDRCAERFPFIEIVRRLNSDFDFASGGREMLRDPGLWNRLIFQYYAHDELPHRDIYDRTAGAANEIGYTITMGMLNVALSNGRLFRRMADHIAKTERSDGNR
ncbi:MAG: hypothetical protein P4L46_15300 [Fimbriimonas sp.]|nr:hypothetical protein [Fimbriimonas sp.]